MSLAPFDFIGDTLRGTRGVIMDMFRQPDAVLEACDRLAPVVVKWVTRRTNPFTPPLVFIPLHKGADSFMSVEQFQKFYWPSLRKVIDGLVADGFVPYLFAEGAYGTRLETIADVPKGRTVWQFDHTDMRRAKQILGRGGMYPGECSLAAAAIGDRRTKLQRTAETSSKQWGRVAGSSSMSARSWTTPSRATSKR